MFATRASIPVVATAQQILLCTPQVHGLYFCELRAERQPDFPGHHVRTRLLRPKFGRGGSDLPMLHV